MNFDVTSSYVFSVHVSNFYDSPLTAIIHIELFMFVHAIYYLLNAVGKVYYAYNHFSTSLTVFFILN